MSRQRAASCSVATDLLSRNVAVIPAPQKGKGFKQLMAEVVTSMTVQLQHTTIECKGDNEQHSTQALKGMVLKKKSIKEWGHACRIRIATTGLRERRSAESAKRCGGHFDKRLISSLKVHTYDVKPAALSDRLVPRRNVAGPEGIAAPPTFLAHT